MATKDFVTEKRNEIERVFNCFPISSKVIEQMPIRTHRTTQQCAMDFCRKFIREMAKLEYTDLRNEASVKLAKDLMAIPGVPEILDRPLPYV